MQYQELKSGDVLHKGDEMKFDGEKWEPISDNLDDCIVFFNHLGCVKYRRPLRSVGKTTPNKRMAKAVRKNKRGRHGHRHA